MVTEFIAILSARGFPHRVVDCCIGHAPRWERPAEEAFEVAALRTFLTEAMQKCEEAYDCKACTPRCTALWALAQGQFLKCILCTEYGFVRSCMFARVRACVRACRLACLSARLRACLLACMCS